VPRSPLGPEAWCDPKSAAEAELARKVCERCPELCACRNWSLGLPLDDQWGVLGGKTAMERRQLIRERQRRGAA
jgi:hypothetical protein